jgi:hypothetical protein
MMISAIKPRTPNSAPNIVAYGGPELSSSDVDWMGSDRDVLVSDDDVVDVVNVVWLIEVSV